MVGQFALPRSASNLRSLRFVILCFMSGYAAGPRWTQRVWVAGARGVRTPLARTVGRLLVGVVLAAGAVFYILALWKVPDLMHLRKAQDRYNSRVLVISAGGAVVVAIGLLYTARNYRLSHRGQVTDRFTKALERLGSDELYVRIGGVHALEHVMRDSADHHHDAVEVLSAFIRRRAPKRRRPNDIGRWMHPVTGSDADISTELPDVPDADIQAALTALANRPVRPERESISLAGLHLAGASLRRCDLIGADLRETNLSHAQLDGVDLGIARLDGADLRSARLDGAEARSSGTLTLNTRRLGGRI